MVPIRIYRSQSHRKFQGSTSMNSTENIREGYRNGLSKTALEFENCIQQLFTLTVCLPVCIWAQIARAPFNYTITARKLLAKRDDYQFQRWILKFSALEKNNRIASVFIITRAVSKSRYVERRESGSIFMRQTVSWSSNESSRKHENKEPWPNDEIHSSRNKTNSNLPVSLFASHICMEARSAQNWYIYFETYKLYLLLSKFSLIQFLFCFYPTIDILHIAC